MPRADWSHRRRFMLSASEVGVPGVLHFGRYNYASARRGLPPHRHRDAMEICVLVRGRQVYEVAGERYVLTGGDVFVTFPGEVHGTGGAPEEKGVLYWLILKMPPSTAPAWLGLSAAQQRALRRALLGLPRRHFRGSWRLRSLLDSMTTRLLRARAPLDSIALQNDVIAFLLELVRTAATKSQAGASKARPLTAVLAHIASHVGEPLPLAQLAALAGLSMPRFKARFTSELGVPPGEYVLRARVAEAERRLRETSESVTRIAFDLGFSSSQYFATVMKRYTGQTPGQLRETTAAED